MRRSSPSSLALLGSLLLVPAAASADSAYDGVAIQRLKFKMAHELAIAVGAMPLDPFQKSLTASLSYTAHFDEYISWEVFQVYAAHLTSTNLRDELIDTFAIPPEDFAAPRFMLTTGLQLSPVYGKQVFLNDVVVHQEAFLGIHGGLIFGDQPTIGDTLADLRPAVGVGVGYRVFMDKNMSVRIDVRDFFAFRRAIRSNESTRFENVLILSAGIAFNLWRDDA